MLTGDGLCANWQVEISLRQPIKSQYQERSSQLEAELGFYSNATRKNAKYALDAFKEQDKVEMHKVPEALRREVTGESNQNGRSHALIHTWLV